MIFGAATKVEEPEEKREHLRRFVNGVIPNQRERLRPMLDKEFKATTLLSLPIDEASAKVHAGQPENEKDDYAFPVWAGLVPIHFSIEAPIADPRNLPGVEMPDDVLKFRIG